MTRINCVPPHELHSKHLVAEYRELPRVFKLAEASFNRGDDPLSLPQQYVLGAGHVKFFYTRLSYLSHRWWSLRNEMLQRGYAPHYDRPPSITLPDDYWWRDWAPTTDALAINRQRLLERAPRS